MDPDYYYDDNNGYATKQSKPWEILPIWLYLVSP